MTRTSIQRRRRPPVGLALLLCSLLAGSALAQDQTPRPDASQAPVADDLDLEESDEAPTEGIEERVVLAGESDAVADFSASDSVTGFNAADLEAVGAFNVADLAKFTPNLEIVTAGNTSPTFFIRGVGLNDFNPNSSGAVAIYQDDVPVNSPALQLSTLFDMEAVNIQRGPQGTGPARNASAGAIKLYSKKPSGNYGGYFKASYGRFNAIDLEGAFEAPIVEDILSSRFAFRAIQRDGFAKNRCGKAPAFSDRGVRTIPQSNATDPRWSICGEAVTVLGTGPANDPSDGISDIPVGLPTDINDQSNWAARGTFLFTPTLDMEFLINAHGTRRDEQSRLGQSAGTGGFFCDTLLPIDECFGPLPRPGRIKGLLGGSDSKGFVNPDGAEMSAKRKSEELAFCEPNCTLDQGRSATNFARIATSKQLANKLDKRPFRGEYDRVGKTTNDTYGAVVKGDITLPGDLSLTTVSGYDGYDRKIDVDLDFTPNVLFEIFTDDDAWQFTQTLSLAGQLFPDSVAPLDWEVGGFTLIERLSVKVRNDFGDRSFAGVAGREYTQDINSAAGYFSFSWDFWDDFTLDGGARYNWEEKKIDFTLDRNGVLLFDKQSKAWQAPTGTIRLTYRFREDTHAYWKYTRGWKGGHFNATSSLLKGVTRAEPEEIDAFEVGLRGSWFDGRLGADVALFYYNYNNYQIFTAEQSLGGQPEFVVLNANKARVFGADITTTARPWTGAFMEARFGWLESKFLDFVQTQLTRKPVGVFDSVIISRENDNSGNRLLNSPRFKISLTAEQTFQLERYGSLVARYDGAWTDDTFYDGTEGRGIPNEDDVLFLPGNTIGQKAFWLHNARLAYTTPDGSIELAGWVRNITNKAYKTFAFDGSTFSGITIAFVGDPRTYGATLTVNF